MILTIVIYGSINLFLIFCALCIGKAIHFRCVSFPTLPTNIIYINTACGLYFMAEVAEQNARIIRDATKIIIIVSNLSINEVLLLGLI